MNSTVDSLLEVATARSRKFDSTDDTTAVYLLLLALCKEIGAFGKKVFYPANGADLFPALFGGSIHTVDMRLSEHQVLAAFNLLCRGVLNRETTMIAGEVPANLERWRHDTTSLAVEEFAAQVGQFVGRNGTVVFKHALPYLLAYDQATASLRWLDLLLESMPTGTTVVVFESNYGAKSALGDSLSSHMRRSNLFEDILAHALTGKQKILLHGVNDKIRQQAPSKMRCRIPGLQSAEVYFEGAGALSVWMRA